MNREQWLNEIANRMAPRFEEIGFPLPKFRAAIGFTSGGMRASANGECWHPKSSDDGVYEILIRPDVSESFYAAAILCHELTHTAVGFAEKHGGKFVKVMKALGLAAPFTSTVPTDAFNDWVKPFIEELGPLPHASLRWTSLAITPGKKPIVVGKVAKALRLGEDLPDSDGEPTSTAKPKQGTRLKKASCSVCGYTVRVTQKWLEVGPPHCPQHGAMTAVTDDETPTNEGE